MSAYLGARTAAVAESERLRLLETCWDPCTTRRLAALGVGPGWRCLEVGAGHGSIAGWLAERVRPTGSVVAADIDPRFLGDVPAGVEVRRIDAGRDGFEAGAYDLVHCRALLMHLPDPDAAFARMVAAVRPGGVLLAEEGDYGLLRFDGHPEAERINALAERAVTELAEARIMDGRLGRRLPGLLTRSGLTLGGAEVETSVAVAGDPHWEFERATACAAADNMLALGIYTDAEAGLLKSFFAGDGAVVTTLTMVAAWGRRPLTSRGRTSPAPAARTPSTPPGPRPASRPGDGS